MGHSEQAACRAGHSRRPTDQPRSQARDWLGRLIDSPAWVNSPLQQREVWLNIYLERL